MSNSKERTLLLLVSMNVVLSSAATSAFASSATTEQVIAPEHQGSITQSDATSGTSTTNLDGTAAENAKVDVNNTNMSAAAATTPNDSTPLQGKVTRKHLPTFGLFGRRWTTEDYRSLNYGILGVILVKFPFSKAQRIVRVFPDCPAVQSGVRPGDVVVQIADHVLSAHETQRTTWDTADGVAGTHVDYTVRRHGQLITFDLTRMNIEDIQNDSIRRMYERMLRELGPPKAARDGARASAPTENSNAP